MIKTKISDKYNQLVPSFGGTSYSQVTEYLLKEKDTFSDEGKELICMNFPGHKKENFKARLRDDDMKSLIGAYYNWAANLVEIDLSHNKIGNDGSNLISKLLDKAESLRKLNLKSNEISDNGSDKIALSLLNKPELVEVNLNSNLITDKGMLQLIEVIYNTPSLLVFDIGNNRVGWSGIIGLTLALSSVNTLKVLNVSDPSYPTFDQDFFTHFGKMLLNNNGLVKLCLANQKIRSEGCNIIVEKLKKNNTLEVLDLTGNQIDFEGMERFVELLDESKSLFSIILKGNRINNEGAWIFARAVAKNHRVAHLDLTNNNIGSTGLIRLAEAMEGNASIISFKVFWGNKFDQPAKEAFREMMEKKDEDFYPDYEIYETEYDTIDMAYLETHCPEEKDYLI